MCKLCTISMAIGALVLVLLALPSFAPAGSCGGDSGGIGHAHGEANAHQSMGICPVSGKPGSSQFSLKVGSKTHYFCSAAHLAEFRSRPLHYLKRMHRNKKMMKTAVCPVTGKTGRTGKCSSLVKGKCCGTCDNAKMSKACPAMKAKGCGTAMSKSWGTCPHSGKKAKCCGVCQTASKKGCSSSSCSDFKQRYFHH